MATKRQVKRPAAGGRQAIVKQYNTRSWYELPDWASIWLTGALAWVALVFAVILAPAASLALVLGFNALPLQYFGIPATASDFGLAAFVLLIEFILLALAVRPLFRKQRKGLKYLVAAATVRFAHSIILQHAISGALMLATALYLYWQLKHRFAESD